ncbi:hypothetical protein IWZ00DRAFT_510601 [Phyllosticta capitalensis]|uniref:uncharacterized protein n=1 Tax=Phyllosticta capitalensis TaxID=121624 RepID=UPI00312CFA72
MHLACRRRAVAGLVWLPPQCGEPQPPAAQHHGLPCLTTHHLRAATPSSSARVGLPAIRLWAVPKPKPKLSLQAQQAHPTTDCVSPTGTCASSQGKNADHVPLPLLGSKVTTLTGRLTLPMASISIANFDSSWAQKLLFLKSLHKGPPLLRTAGTGRQAARTGHGLRASIVSVS